MPVFQFQDWITARSERTESALDRLLDSAQTVPNRLHEAMRYVVRLVHDLATQGAYDRALELPGLHAGEVVVVTPNPNQGKVNACLVNGIEAIKTAQ